MATAAVALVGLLIWTMTPQDKSAPTRQQESPRAREIDEWIARLSHNDPAEREKAEKQLGSLAKDLAHAIAALEKAGKSDDAQARARAARVRKALIAAVAGLATPEAAEPTIEELDKAVRNAPSDPAAYLKRAEYRFLRCAEDAREDINTALRLDPANANAYLLRGRVRHARGDLAGAIADWTEAIRISPGSAEAFMRRGIARTSLGDFDGALADYDHAVQIEPGSADLYFHRAATRAAQGDPPGALADYARALALAPDKWAHRAETERSLKTLRERLGK